MTCIVFKLRSNLSLQMQERILQQVRGWHRGNKAGRVHFDSRNHEELSLCYVYVSDETDAQTTLRSLQKTNEVEYVNIPADRQPVASPTKQY